MKNRYIVAVIFLFSLCSVNVAGRTKGYEKGIEINAAVGLGKLQKYSFGIGTVHGYRFNQYFFLGGGASYEYLDGLYYQSYEYRGRILGSESYYSDNVENSIKLFGRAKVNFTKTRVSPFIAIDCGYTFNLSSIEIRMAEGVFFHPAVGCNIKVGENQELYIMIGYNAQRYYYKYFSLTDLAYGDSGEKNVKTVAEKINFVLGFNF